MIRKVLGPPAGLIVMYVLFTFLDVMAAKATMGRLPAREAMDKAPLGYILANLGVGFISALGGGYVCAWVARGRAAGWIFAAIMALVSAEYATAHAGGAEPTWYLWSLAALCPLGILAGNWARGEA